MKKRDLPRSIGSRLGGKGKDLAELTCVFLVVVAIATPARSDPWADAYDPAAKTRFIPVELWTGAEWDGAKVIKAGKADLTFGAGGAKRITGPEPFVRPDTNETILIYRRINRDKTQLFTVSSKKDGLGRVYDSRIDKKPCSDEVKFPLGLWRQGETREYKLHCGPRTRTIRMTIEDIDFVHAGVPHSLRYRWILEGAGRGGDNTYVYSPGKGNVEVVENVR